MPKPVRAILKAIRPYCKDIRVKKKHYVCRPILGNRIVVISASSSDIHYYKNVYKDFLKCGLDIPEILK